MIREMIKKLRTCVWILFALLLLPTAFALQTDLNSIVVEVTATSAQISWITDLASQGSIEIGTDINQLRVVPETAALRTNHQVTIEGLTPNTLYYYRIKSTTTTEEHSTTFRSLKTLLEPPTGLRAEEVTHNSARLVWAVNTAATGYNVYLNTELKGRARNTLFTLTNLTPETQYAVQVTALDSLGRESSYSEPLQLTTLEAPATISFLTVADLTNVSATITWRTNKETGSKILYDTTMALQRVQEDTTQTLNHSLTLSDLLPDTRYFFKVISGGAQSAVQDFRTLSNRAVGIEIVNVSVEANESAATIQWKTSVETRSRIIYSTDDSFNLVKDDGRLTKDHTLVLTNLQHNTRYYFRIVADEKISPIYEFTTGESVAKFLSVDPLPEITNQVIINISGRTRPRSRVYISVNDEYQVRKTLNGTEFHEQIRLRQSARYNATPGNNLVKVEAWDARGIKDTFIAYIILDNIPPHFELNPVPHFTNAAVLNISGISEPNISVEVFFTNTSVAKFVVGQENITSENLVAFEHGIPTHASANYTLFIRATDRANNVLEFKQELIIDKVVPQVELKQLPKETHFKLFKVEGKTESHAYVTVVNFGEFEGCEDVAFIRQFGECTEFDSKTSASGTQMKTDLAIDPFGVAYGEMHSAQANENGDFSVLISLIPGKDGRGGDNKLKFYVADEAGNVNTNVRAILKYTPGCPEWHISNVQSMPFNIYTEELHERDLPASIFYTLDYIGQGTPQLSQLVVREDESGSSLVKPAGGLEVGANVLLQRGVNNTNDYVTVNEQAVKFSKYDPENNKVYVYVPLVVNRYMGTIKQLPDELGVYLRNYMVYTVDGVNTAPCVVYPVASFDIQKPENVLKWISPEHLNKTIQKLDEAIRGTQKVVEYTTTAARITLVGCGAGLALKYLSGFVDKSKGCDTSLKWIFAMCDRVLCPRVPENCNAFDIGEGTFKMGAGPENTYTNLDLTAREKITHQQTTNARFREAYNTEYNQWLRSDAARRTVRGTTGSFDAFLATKQAENDPKYQQLQQQYGGGYAQFEHPTVYRTQKGENEIVEVEYRDLTQYPLQEQFIGGRVYRCPRDSKTMILHTRFEKDTEKLFGESAVRGYDVECDSRSTSELGPPRTDQIPGCYTEGCDLHDRPRFDETKCLFGAGYGINPPEDLWSSVKCGCLPGVRGHLQNWIKIMTAMKGCLQQAMIGEIRGGFCERLAAQFVCDIFIQLFKFIIHTADQPGESRGVGGLKEGIENYKYNSQRISNALEDRYGGVLKERLKLTSDDLINKACVAAITLDWSMLDGILDNIIDSIDVPPVVAVYGTSRPYGYDPFSGRFSIGYNIYVGIVPGGDTNVRAYMVCDRNKEGGEYCGRGVAKYPMVQVPEFMTKNDMFNENILFVDDNAKYWYNQVCIETEYRIGGETRRETQCDSIKRRGDLSLLNCRFDTLAGIQCKALEQVGGPLGQIGIVELHNTEAGSKATPPQATTHYNGNTVSALVKLKNSFKEDFYLRINNGLQTFEYPLMGRAAQPGQEGLTGFGDEQTYLVALDGIGTPGQVQPQFSQRFAKYNAERNPSYAIKMLAHSFGVKLPDQLSRARLTLEYTSSQFAATTPSPTAAPVRIYADCSVERDPATGTYKNPYGVFMPQGFVEIKGTSASSGTYLWEDFCKQPQFVTVLPRNTQLQTDCAQPWSTVMNNYYRIEDGHYKCLIPQDVFGYTQQVPGTQLEYVQSVDIAEHSFTTPDNVNYQQDYVFMLKGTDRPSIPMRFQFGSGQYSQQYAGATHQARINVLSDVNKNGQGDTEITFTLAGGVSKSQEFSIGYQVQNAPANGMASPEVEIIEPLQDYSTGIRNGYFNNDHNAVPLGIVIWDDAQEIKKILFKIRSLNPRNSFECATEFTYDKTNNKLTESSANACGIKVNEQRSIGLRPGWPSYFSFWFDPPATMTRTQDDYYAVAVQVEDTKNLKSLDTARFVFDQRVALSAEDLMVCLGGGYCSGPYEPPNTNVYEIPGTVTPTDIRTRPAESYRYESFVGGRSPYEEEAQRMQQDREKSSIAVRMMAEQGITSPPSGFSITYNTQVINFEAKGLDTRNYQVVFIYESTDANIRVIIDPKQKRVIDSALQEPYKGDASAILPLIETAFSSVYTYTPPPPPSPPAPQPLAPYVYDADLVQFAQQSGIPLQSKFGEFRDLGQRTPGDIQFIVLHHTGTPSAESAMTAMKSASTSAHFLIEQNGALYYLVDELKVANHIKSTSLLTDNRRSIGIEIVNTGGVSVQYTAKQYDTLNKLLKYLTQKYSTVPYDHAHILAHYEVDPPLPSTAPPTATEKKRKWDPSPNFDWTQINLAGHRMLKDIVTKADCQAQIDFEATGYSCDNVFP